MASTSRIIVKGLGPNTSETHLRNHFKEGEITDVKVMRTKGGKSRQFAFLGFRTSDQAAEAKEYYDKTFLQSSRIGIEMATKRDRDGHDHKNGEDDTHKGKKQKKGSNNTNDNDNGAEKAKDVKPVKKDKHLDDFLEVTKSRKVSHLWENDIDLDNQAAKNGTKKGFEDSESGFVDQGGDQTSKKSQISEDDKHGASDSDSDSDESENEIDEDGNIRSVPKKKNTAETKKSIFEDKRKKNTDDAEMDMEEKDDAVMVDDSEMIPSDNMAESGDGHMDPLRLYVTNIPYGCAEEELQELFGTYGEIMNIHIPLGDEKGGRGYAFVKFEESSSSQQALVELDQSSFQGRVLHITHARVAGKNARTKELEEADVYSGYLSPRDRWEKSRQKMMKSTAYNAAYMDQNAIVDSLAQSHNLQASDILNVKGDAKGGDIAVRMAIGETKIIQDNKTFFAKHGVNMSALDSQLSNKKASRRSSTILLIKNLPASDSNSNQDDSYNDLERMFAGYGDLSSFLVPPSKTVALVEYIEPNEARSAFKALAYRKYRNLPLYLEWAPIDVMLNTKSNDGNNSSNNSKAKADKMSEKKDDTMDESVAEFLQSGKEKRKAKEEEDNYAAATESAAKGGEQVVHSSTLYVKNLDFSIGENELRSHLNSKNAGDSVGLRSISVPTSNGKAYGYAFVEYSSESGAKAALQAVHRTSLKSRLMEVELSTKKTHSASPSNKDKKKKKKNDATSNSTSKETKLAVRNVAFQANKEELLSLFSAFGTVKSVKLPKKIDGTHRGFAFVEYSHHLEASEAMQALASTHLYGRHLVLEYAKKTDQDA